MRAEPCERPRCFGHVFFADLPHEHHLRYYFGEGWVDMMLSIYGAEPRYQLALPGFGYDSDGFVMWTGTFDTV